MDSALTLPKPLAILLRHERHLDVAPVSRRAFEYLLALFRGSSITRRRKLPAHHRSSSETVEIVRGVSVRPRIVNSFVLTSAASPAISTRTARPDEPDTARHFDTSALVSARPIQSMISGSAYQWSPSESVTPSRAGRQHPAAAPISARHPQSRAFVSVATMVRTRPLFRTAIASSPMVPVRVPEPLGDREGEA